MLKIPLQFLSGLDFKIENSIYTFLEKTYFPPGNLPFFSSILPKIIKLLFYSSCITILMFVIKILYPYKKSVNFALISLIIMDAILLTLIFIGFMQLLYG